MSDNYNEMGENPGTMELRVPESTQGNMPARIAPGDPVVADITRWRIPPSESQAGQTWVEAFYEEHDKYILLSRDYHELEAEHQVAQNKLRDVVQMSLHIARDVMAAKSLEAVYAFGRDLFDWLVAHYSEYTKHADGK